MIGNVRAELIGAAASLSTLPVRRDPVPVFKPSRDVVSLREGEIRDTTSWPR